MIFKNIKVYRRGRIANLLQFSSCRRIITSSNECMSNREESSWKYFYEKTQHKQKVKIKEMAEYYNANKFEMGYSKGDDPIRKNSKENQFSMILPPPNITGSLHLGHALTVFVQDSLMIWNQMNGKDCMWLPGCDHAGIATQVRVEKLLKKTENLDPGQINRDEFLNRAYDWKADRESIIFDQLHALGTSLSFQKSYFTLDKNFSNAVNEAFVRLHSSGLIYRKSAIINWCCSLQSAISDIEIDYLEVNGPKEVQVPGYDGPVAFGQLYYFSYKAVDSDSEIIVATTRPETILGDVAVAVHPDDERYTAFHGAMVWNPISRCIIPVICDKKVDRGFGTGAVKITPAHDYDDYEVGTKHGLEMKKIFDEEGRVHMPGNIFDKLQRFRAREEITKSLRDLGSLKKIDGHDMKVPVCSRSGDIIEPYLMPQWYLKCEKMAERAVENVKTGKIRLVPKNHESVWFNWLENIRDWCISRQLKWGHKIPAYEVIHPQVPPGTWVCGKSKKEAVQQASELCSMDIEEKHLNASTDVLDTWFSSALIPPTALGWPNENSTDYQKFYPLNLMETGSDILFFWVARMAMLCEELTGKIPFQEVLLHGLITDSKGKKMSKSLGNVLNPDDIINGATIKQLHSRVEESVKHGYLTDEQAIEAKQALCDDFPDGIPQCSSDGLRFYLLNHNIKRDKILIESSGIRNSNQITSKIWQIARFINATHAKYSPIISPIDQSAVTPIQKWMLHRTAQTAFDIENAFKKYDIHIVCALVREFWFNIFSSVFLECVKPDLLDENKRHQAFNVLLTCLHSGLLFSAPIVPFVCNNVYSVLPSCDMHPKKYEDIRQARFPDPALLQGFYDDEIDDDFKIVLKVVKVIRDMKLELRGNHQSAEIYVEDNKTHLNFQPLFEYVQILTRIKDMRLINSKFQHRSSKSRVSYLGDVVVNISVKDEANIDLKLEQKLRKIEKEIEKLQKLVSNEDFRKKAKENVRVEKKAKLLRLLSEKKSISSLMK